MTGIEPRKNIPQVITQGSKKSWKGLLTLVNASL